MLRKSKRLTTSQVQEVLSRGRGRRGTLLSLKNLATTTPFRCSVVVSKKVAKTAVLRNRLRRAVYRALSGASLPPTGHAILFVQSVPKEPLTTAFKHDITTLLNV